MNTFGTYLRQRREALRALTAQRHAVHHTPVGAVVIDAVVHRGSVVPEGERPGRDFEANGLRLPRLQIDAAEAVLDKLADIFPNRLYVELQRHGLPEERAAENGLIDLAYAKRLPLVATNDVRFLDKEEFEAHEARVCINEGRVLDDPRRERRYSEEQYLKSPEQMAELFSDIPEALANTVEIAKRCTLELELGKACLPNYPVPEGMTLEQFFEKLSVEGLQERLQLILKPDDEQYIEKKQQ